ncbi:hypothetical protein KEM48_003067 [Puccinia striiformis f. sp. tritici PST-130]|nr:hypothetical protein KEM48_003067 [Puccinia striiformis f. sp. tritici PST-130]
MARAQRETTLPNQTSTNPRRSTWVHTPLECPGFIQTNPDSRQALKAPPRSPLAVNLANCQEDVATTGTIQPATKSSTKHVDDEETEINIARDSDKENMRLLSGKLS